MEERDDAGVFCGLAGALSGRPDRRPPLILLHGLTFDRRMWQPALAEFRKADAGRQVLALDLPGHGGSARWPAYSIESVADAVHAAAAQAGLHAPVVVGHSMAALIAMDYAARYPALGVVNVDQWLRVEPFIGFVKSLAGEICGSGFAGAWQHFEESMHLEMLPAQGRRLLRPPSTVRQDLVVGYWREGLNRPTHEMVTGVEATIAKLRANRTSYLFIAGHSVEPEYLGWLGRQLPQASTETWPDSGHFPHLANPARFAVCLAGTARWSTKSRDAAS